MVNSINLIKYKTVIKITNKNYFEPDIFSLNLKMKNKCIFMRSLPLRVIKTYE